jgi:hypothetical protein
MELMRSGARIAEIRLHPINTESAADWFSAYFEKKIIVRYAPEGVPDAFARRWRSTASQPSGRINFLAKTNPTVCGSASAR